MSNSSIGNIRVVTDPMPTIRKIAVLLLFGLLSGAGCGAANEAQPVANGTPEAAVGGVQAIVTRIVNQITFVTSTPDATAIAQAQKPLIVLDMSLAGELPNLDPGVAESQAQLDLTQNLFAGLTNFNPDTKIIEPELATSWTVSPDGLTWTFDLRDDIYWVKPRSPRPGGGELWSATQVRPVTAGDVVYAVRRHCNREVDTALAFTLFIIEGCEEMFTTLDPEEANKMPIGVTALDPTTLEIRLTEPAGHFLTLTSMPFFQPVPAEVVEELGNEWLNAIGEFSSGWQTPSNLMTSGPFLPASTGLTSQFVVLHRNPLWPIERTGNVDVVNITFFDDDLDAFELWQERNLDFSPLPTSERESFILRSAAKVRTVPNQVLFYLGYNFGSPVFSEPEVRRAMSAAIDRQELIDELYEGRGLVMRHATVPGIVAAIPVDEIGVGYSPDYARQQMAASSFRSCRLMPEVTFLVSSADLSLRQAEIIRDMWVEELDCLKESIHIEQTSFGQLLAATQPDATGRPDLWELAWAPTFPDAGNLINDLLHCRDSENRQNRECSETDTLLTNAGSIIDPVERANLYRQAEAQFFGETGTFPIAPLYIRSRELVVHDWISFTPVAFGGQQWDRIIIDAAIKELEQSR